MEASFSMARLNSAWSRLPPASERWAAVDDGEPTIARLPEATPANPLRVGALDASSRGILTLEGFGGLPLPRRLQRLIRLALLESQEAWLLLCPGTLRPARARRAILPGKANLPCHAILVGVWEPGD